MATAALEQLWESATLIDHTVKSIGEISCAMDHYNVVTPMQPGHRLLYAEHCLEAAIEELAEGEVVDDPNRAISTFTIKALGSVRPVGKHAWWKTKEAAAKSEADILASVLGDTPTPADDNHFSNRRCRLIGEDWQREQPYLGEDVFRWLPSGEVKSDTVIFGDGQKAVDQAPSKQSLRFYRLFGRYVAGPTPSIEEAAEIVRTESRRIGSAFQRQRGRLGTDDLWQFAQNVIRHGDLPHMPISYIVYDRKSQLVPRRPEPPRPRTSSERFSTMWIDDREPQHKRYDSFLHVDRLVGDPGVEPGYYAAVLSRDMTGSNVPIGIRVNQWFTLCGDRDSDQRTVATTPEVANEMLEPMLEYAKTIREHAELFRSEQWQILNVLAGSDPQKIKQR